MKKLIGICIAIMLSSSIQSQTTVIPLDIKGLNIREKYTDAQMRSALGEPSKFRKWVDEFGEGREYQYFHNGKSDIYRYTEEMGGLIGVTQETPLVGFFSGRIKVGDHISKFSTLGGGHLINEGNNEYHFFSGIREADEWTIVQTDSNGTIVVLTYCNPN